MRIPAQDDPTQIGAEMVLELSAVSVTIITLAAALYVGNQLAEFMNYWGTARIT